ncbi:hypothetical protein GCM10011374_37630 [Kocuria dechangensis]|uniref:VCBS repeat-containing protein n=1 Tax=Kocuria dechangensis TaxID=1176249 RepID=A0A917H7L1_9MICC|nr:VCBS repeat-containing protein [Kocuria dechangensis]GGG69639.1 hypothetical protein GCM10011374_37630 [Kocuria dechangensis]
MTDRNQPGPWAAEARSAEMSRRHLITAGSVLASAAVVGAASPAAAAVRESLRTQAVPTGRTDIALVRQQPGWNTIPVAFAQPNGNWQVTNGAAPNFIADWAHAPGVRVITGDFNNNGRTDIALVRQTPGWNTIPVAFSQGNGTWQITNRAAPNFIASWAPTPGVQVVTGNFR